MSHNSPMRSRVGSRSFSGENRSFISGANRSKRLKNEHAHYICL